MTDYWNTIYLGETVHMLACLKQLQQVNHMGHAREIQLWSQSLLVEHGAWKAAELLITHLR